MFQLLDFPNARRALQVYGKLFTEHLKKELLKDQYPYAPGFNNQGTTRDLGNKVASRKLYNSIKFSVETDGEGDPILVLSYVNYFENVNLGRRPGKGRYVVKNGRRVLQGGVPIKALLDWIKIRGLRVYNEKGNPIPSLSLAFAIQTNIYKFGIKPANIYDKGLDGLFTEVENPPADLSDELQEIYNMIAEDVNMFLDRTITREIT